MTSVETRDVQPVAAPPALLEVRDLHVEFGRKDRPARVLNGVNLTVLPGDSIGIVGETGCGKSLTARAMMGLLPRGARVTGGGVFWEGAPLPPPGAALRRIRGRRMAMVFQGARSALNPVKTVGGQLRRVVRNNRGLDGTAARAAVLDMLAQVEISDPERRYDQYPHELSGGMCQRVMIAMALLCAPDLIVLDEPTTGLDVTVQAGILELIEGLVADRRMAVVLISHDLGVVGRVCDRVGVMYAGRFVESGQAQPVLTHALHPYTRQLAAARLPSLGAAARAVFPATWSSVPDPVHLPAGCHFKTRCPLRDEACDQEPPIVRRGRNHESRCHHVEELEKPTVQVLASPPRRAPGGGAPSPSGDLVRVTSLRKDFRVRGSHASLRAVDGVDLAIPRGQSLAVVGESGSGKSTLGRCVLGLVQPSAGAVFFDDQEITTMKPSALRRLRRRMQMVFQDPWESLNPRRTVSATVGEPLRLHLGLRGDALRGAVSEVLERVNLEPALADRYPSQLSGGQRQRVGIARAIATEPDFVVLDEPTSSLDTSVQQQVLALLHRLQQELGLTYLLISHDLSVVRHMARDVAVMYLGAVVETGPTERVFTRPQHPYTQALLSAVPRPRWESGAARLRLLGEAGSALGVAREACRMTDRCPLVMQVCHEVSPELHAVNEGQRVACHAVGHGR